jgi:hypothetical protein
MAVNWFAVGVVLLQSGAGVTYIVRGSGWYGFLWLLYAFTNVVLMRMEVIGK